MGGGGAGAGVGVVGGPYVEGGNHAVFMKQFVFQDWLKNLCSKDVKQNKCFNRHAINKEKYYIYLILQQLNY